MTSNKEQSKPTKPTSVLLTEIVRLLEENNKMLSEMNTNLKVIAKRFGEMPCDEDGGLYVSINNSRSIGKRIADEMIF
jgi:hypothetical protein